MKNKIKINTMISLTLMVLFAAFIVAPVNAAVGDRVYFDPDPSNPGEVQLRVDATAFQGGQIELLYDPDCCEVTSFVLNSAIYTFGTNDLTNGRVWITFMAGSPMTEDNLIGTLTIQCASASDCTSTLGIDNPDSKLKSSTGDTISDVDWQDGEFNCDNGGNTDNRVYFNPDPSNPGEVQLRVDATAFQGGQVELLYDPDCCEVTSFVLNSAIYTFGTNDLTNGRVWITFMAGSPMTEDNLIGTLTIQCASASDCTSVLDIDNPDSKLKSSTGDTISDVDWQNGQFICSLNNPPSVTVNYPNSGKVGGTITLSATAEDTDGTVTNVEFSYSATGTAPWTVLGSGADVGADEYEYSWDTTTVSDGSNYKIKAEATDNDGATGEDTSNDVFEIDNTCQCHFCLELDTGVNFVSIPKTIDAGDIKGNTIFDIDSYSSEQCMYYNPNDGWDTNPDVVPCRGFQVTKENPMTVCVYFDLDSHPSHPLYTGWNMIGHVHTENTEVYVEGDPFDFTSKTGLEDPEDTMLFRQLNTYSQSTGWSYYPDFSEMIPGVGYYVLMKQDTTMWGMQ